MFGERVITSCSLSQLLKICISKGFPDSSVGKKSVCNAGDLSSIPELGRSAGEGIGYSLQYSWASLVAQLVKNLPAMQENWLGLIPGLGRSPGEGKGYPHKNMCIFLEKPAFKQGGPQLQVFGNQ